MFSRADSGDLLIAFSVWNVGEVLGALDQRHRRGFLTQGELNSALLNFVDDTLRLTRRGAMQLRPITDSVLADSWRILLDEHVYAADALQIASCKHADCDLFVSADRTLLESAKAKGLTALDPERDEKKVISV